MTREEAIWWVNHLFEIRKEEYFNKGMMKDAKEVEEAQYMAIEALSEPSNKTETVFIYPFGVDNMDEPSLKAIKKQIDEHWYLDKSGDLISRADAIEAVQAYLNILINSRRHGDDFTFINVLTEIRNKILALPSADAVQGWISLSHDDYGLGTDFPHERDGEWVIVTDGKNISVERIKKDAYDHFFPNGRWFELEDVIAWMPLPTPYECGARMKGGEK